MRSILISCLLMVFSFSGFLVAATVGYWQLDGGTDSRDAIMAHGTDDYLDLTSFGTINQASAPVDPVPNPAGATWRWQAGDGEADGNSGSQSIDGGAGWYLSPTDSQLYFDNNSSFTAECWFKAGSASGYIMGNRHADSYLETSGWFTGWQLWVTGGPLLTLYAEGNPTLAQGGVASPIILSTSITLGTWYHAAVVWDHDDGSTGTLKLYLDGVPVDSSAGDPAWSGTSGGSWAIGQRNLWIDEGDLGLGTLWGQTGFSGSVDEVRYVDEVLNPLQFLNGSTVYNPAEDIVPFGDIDIDGDVDLADFGYLHRIGLATHIHRNRMRYNCDV